MLAEDIRCQGQRQRTLLPLTQQVVWGSHHWHFTFPSKSPWQKHLSGYSTYSQFASQLRNAKLGKFTTFIKIRSKSALCLRSDNCVPQEWQLQIQPWEIDPIKSNQVFIPGIPSRTQRDLGHSEMFRAHGGLLLPTHSLSNLIQNALGSAIR